MKFQSILILALFSIGLSVPLSAQDMSWRKHKSLAERLESEGDFFAAAENYRMAWEQKQNKSELIYMAAENYYRVADYRAAADAYQHVDANSSADKLVLLKYARSLKQDGQYDKARTIFQQLQETYVGTDKAILMDIVRTEMQGIELARSLANTMDRRLEILHPGINVNTDNAEFGAVSINDNTIYFSSSMGGKARIYESQRQGRNWTKAANPTSFPVIEGGQYANGSLSPDGQRFYFTICNGDTGWEGINTRCEIYVTRKSANGWTKPEALPEFVNAKGRNTTHPGVAHFQGQEYLFFSSDREGGRGGMDIWYVARDLGIDNMDFTFPVNLGPVINSLGDELTPFFNAEEETLYFASNGLPGIGGFDVFKSKGMSTSWATAINVGLPINSSADDYGYVMQANGFGGFFTSNRPFGGEKTNTRHTDIFEFSIGGRQITLKANVYDESNGSLLPATKVSLYQLFDDGTENLLITRDFQDGSYLFELLPNRRFRVEVKKDGFETGGYVFATDNPSSFTYGQPLYLERVLTETPIEDPVANNTNAGNNNTSNGGGFMTDTTPTNNNAGTSGNTNTGGPTNLFNNDGATYTAKGSSEKDNLDYTSSAPRHNGRYYRIQVAAVRKFDTNHAKFATVASEGVLYTETIQSSGLTRVLVGDYFTQDEATAKLSAIRSTFREAYIVQYDDGVRYGRVNF